MTLRTDHVAGGVLVVFGVVVFAASGDLPLGSMGMPGAGMMPKLVIGFMVGLGMILVLRAGASAPFAAVAWSDLPHAIRVVAVTAAVTTLYTTLGFVIAMTILLFTLTAAIERRPLVHAAAFSMGVTTLAYVLFRTLLKSPLPTGPIGF